MSESKQNSCLSHWKQFSLNFWFFLKAYLDFLVFKGKVTCLGSSILSEFYTCAFIF